MTWPDLTEQLHSRVHGQWHWVPWRLSVSDLFNHSFDFYQAFIPKQNFFELCLRTYCFHNSKHAIVCVFVNNVCGERSIIHNIATDNLCTKSAYVSL